MYRITLIPGDGIGPEIVEPVKEAVKAAGVAIDWDIKEAGQTAVDKYGSPLPDDVIESIKLNKIALKGPVTTQIGRGFKSINVTLRQKLDLYANIRPVKSLPGIRSKYQDIDIVLFRENTEDLYAGIENVIDNERVEAIKVITRKASRRIAVSAFEYSIKYNRAKVTAVHKANIMKLSDGLFLDEVRKVSSLYPQIEYNEIIVDNACMKLVMNPEKFDVIVTENLYGDILSDLCAGLVGGLGVVPGMNVGNDCVIFEAVHGSAPDIAGKNIANPIAILLSAIEMLKYIGETSAASKINNAINKLLSDGRYLTPDLGGVSSTDEMSKELCSIIKSFN